MLLAGGATEVTHSLAGESFDDPYGFESSNSKGLDYSEYVDNTSDDEYSDDDEEESVGDDPDIYNGKIGPYPFEMMKFFTGDDDEFQDKYRQTRHNGDWIELYGTYDSSDHTALSYELINGDTAGYFELKCGEYNKFTSGTFTTQEGKTYTVTFD